MTTLLNPTSSEMNKLFKEQVQDRVSRPSADEMKQRAHEHEMLLYNIESGDKPFPRLDVYLSDNADPIGFWLDLVVVEHDEYMFVPVDEDIDLAVVKEAVEVSLAKHKPGLLTTELRLMLGRIDTLRRRTAAYKENRLSLVRAHEIMIKERIPQPKEEELVAELRAQVLTALKKHRLVVNDEKAGEGWWAVRCNGLVISVSVDNAIGEREDGNVLSWYAYAYIGDFYKRTNSDDLAECHDWFFEDFDADKFVDEAVKESARRWKSDKVAILRPLQRLKTSSNVRIATALVLQAADRNTRREKIWQQQMTERVVDAHDEAVESVEVITKIAEELGFKKTYSGKQYGMLVASFLRGKTQLGMTVQEIADNERNGKKIVGAEVGLTLNSNGLSTSHGWRVYPPESLDQNDVRTWLKESIDDLLHRRFMRQHRTANRIVDYNDHASRDKIHHDQIGSRMVPTHAEQVAFFNQVQRLLDINKEQGVVLIGANNSTGKGGYGTTVFYTKETLADSVWQPLLFVEYCEDTDFHTSGALNQKLKAELKRVLGVRKTVAC
jgi:hypothetical protein